MNPSNFKATFENRDYVRLLGKKIINGLTTWGVEINEKKVMLDGLSLKERGYRARHKFENLLVMENFEKPLRFFYV